jgi:hypothetical protein
LAAGRWLFLDRWQLASWQVSFPLAIATAKIGHKKTTPFGVVHIIR